MPARVIVIEYVYTTALDRTGRQEHELGPHRDSSAHQTYPSYILLYDWLPVVRLLLEVGLISKSDEKMRKTT